MQKVIKLLVKHIKKYERFVSNKNKKMEKYSKLKCEPSEKYI